MIFRWHTFTGKCLHDFNRNQEIMPFGVLPVVGLE